MKKGTIVLLCLLLSAGLLAGPASAADQSSISASQAWELEHMDKTSQGVYLQVLEAFRNYKATINITYPKRSRGILDDFSTMIMLLKSNKPEFFWVSYETGDCQVYEDRVKWSPQYYSKYTTNGKLDQKTTQKVQAKIEENIKDVQRGADDFETVRNINHYLATNVKYSYDFANWDVYEITGSLAEGSSACEGYAKGFKYLCDRLDVDCTVVQGTGILSGKTYGHTWNYVLLDGKWYLVDPTWNSLGSGTERWFLLGTNSTVGGLSLLKSHEPYHEYGYPELAANDYIS